jgi:hypothetical protein
MFQKAYTLAAQYTQPFIVCMRYQDASVDSGLGSFVYLNQEGWAMTAAHNFNAVFGFKQHQALIQNYNERKALIAKSESLSDDEKQQQLQALPYDPKWITHYAIMLSGRLVNMYENYIYGDHDIAFFRMDANAIPPQTKFPKIINPESISPGISLCKLGYPFVEFKASFDEAAQQFVLPPHVLPVPMFPMEGIYTRNVFKGKDVQQVDILFLETSSPGLKGQSGGPIFDREGNLYAVQSQNLTIPLGYSGTIQKNGVGIEENQFLNLGIGVHPQTLITLMERHGIAFEKG